MANSITAAKSYQAVLDKAYAHLALTNLLNTPPEGVRPGVAAGSFLIAKQALVGLGTYSKTSGFPAGDVTLTWEEFTYTQDRGRTFSVDAMDNLESAGQAFGELSREFLRLHVVPEIDAYRMSVIANGAGDGSSGTLSASANWISAIDTAVAALGDTGVAEGNLVLFITYAGYNYLVNSDRNTRYTPPGANPDARFGSWDGIPLVKMPANRFNAEISLNSGSSSSAGGYTVNGTALNFVLMDRSSVFCDAKHAVPRIFEPSVNQSMDAWKFDYRIYHDCFILDNREDGIYAHAVGTIS